MELQIGIMELKENEVIQHLFLTDHYIAENKEFIEKQNIKHVIDVSGCENSLEGYFEERHIEYVSIYVLDTKTCNISEHFDRTFTIIKKALEKNESVLVHCNAGVSRSATIVIAYLMTYRRMDFKKAYNHVKKRRACINPNAGFTYFLQYRYLKDK